MQMSNKMKFKTKVDCEVVVEIESEETALEIVNEWLDVPFDGGRHAMRVGLID